MQRWRFILWARGSMHRRCYCRPPEEGADDFVKLKNWKLISQISEAIKAGENEAASELLPTLKKYDMLTTTNCNEFLQHCSLSANVMFARHIINFMGDNGVEPNNRSRTFVLGALSRAGNLDEALEMLENSEIQDITMYNFVLNGCAVLGSSSHAEKCLKLMATKGVEKDHRTYIELMRLAGKSEKAEAIKELWAELKSRFTPVFNSYRTYVIALCRGNDLDEALAVLQEMLDDLSKNMKVSEPIPAAVTEVFNMIINTASRTGQYQLAEMMFTEMNRLEIPFTISTFDPLIRAVVKGRGVEYALKLVETMQESGIEPDRGIYTAIVEGYCKSSQLDKAESLVEQMLNAKENQRPAAPAFNFILQACSLTNDQERALRVFRRMKTAAVATNICTYTALFCIFGSVNFPYAGGDQSSNDDLSKRLEVIESDMMSSGTPHSRQSFTAMIRGLGAEGMIGPALKRLFTAESFVSEDGTPFLDTFAYNTAMYSCVMFSQFGEAKELFTRMKTKGFKPNLHTYNIMILGCLQDKNVRYANELVSSLKKEFAPNSVTYNCLIKVLCASNELEAALEVVQTMDRAGIEANIYSFNSIISAAALRGRIDMIEFLVEDMKDRKIPPNSYTILKVMLAYIHLKRLDDAIQAVRRLSRRMLEATEGSESSMQNAVEVLMQDNIELVSDMNESLAKSVEESSDPAAEALYSLSLASVAAGVEDEAI